MDAAGPEFSESGQPIYRHKLRATEIEFASVDNQATAAIIAHVETHLGKVDGTIEPGFEELISDLVQINVHRIRPTPDRDFWTFVTTGMSDRPMSVPDGIDDARFAELILCLPRSWKASDPEFQDEADGWPIRLLKSLGRMPHDYATWLAPGHTVPNSDPPEPYARNTRFCCALLVNPLTTPADFDQLTVNSGKQIRFLAVIPLYVEEVELKLKQGPEEIFKRLENQGVTEILNPRRKNVARRSIWPF